MHSRILPLALALAAPAFTQTTPAVVVSTGDMVPGLGPIDYFYGVKVNDLGETLVLAHVDSGDNNYARALYKNGNILIKAGDPGAGVGGEVRFFASYDIADNGDTAVVATVFNAPGLPSSAYVLWIKGNPALVEGDPAVIGDFNAGSTISQIQSAILNDVGGVLIDCQVNDPIDGIQDALVVATYGPAGNITSTGLVARTGTGLPGVGQTVDHFFGTENMSTSFDDLGRPLYGCVLDAAAGTQDNVLYYKTNTLVAQSGSASPIAGRNWLDSWHFAPDTNSSGQIAYRGWLDTSDPSNDQVIMLDGAVFKREGDSAPLSGTTIENFGQGPVKLTEDGRVGYFADTDYFNDEYDACLFMANTIMAREGSTAIEDGTQVLRIHDLLQDYDFSDDGRFCLYTADMLDESTKVLLAENIDYEGYCDAIPNSTGNISVMTPVAGTADTQYGYLLVQCYGLPANKFGYALCSANQGNILMPPGSEGRLCLGGPIGRFVSQVQSSGPSGFIYTEVEMDNLPLGGGTAIQPGESWNFQTWHRDNNPTATSNFSRAMTIEFR